MSDLTITTPALLFPAISLIMLSYTNRFTMLDTVVRKLYAQYSVEENENLHSQIKNLRSCLILTKWMQGLSMISFLTCLISMYFIFFEIQLPARIFFDIGVITFTGSLVLFFKEIQVSTRAIELELADMND